MSLQDEHYEQMAREFWEDVRSGVEPPRHADKIRGYSARCIYVERGAIVIEDTVYSAPSELVITINP